MIVSKTNEEALESCIEKSLLEQGFIKGENKDFDKNYAVDEKIFWDFLESTQKDELEKLKRDPQYRLKITQKLDKTIKKYGILKILKKGFDVDDAHFKLFFITPLASSGQEIQKKICFKYF